MMRNHADFKLQTLFKGPYETFQMETNGTVTLQMGSIIKKKKHSLH